MFFPRFIPSKSSHSGFTLTEILVALAVLGLLAALLFPIFSQARESARQGHCAGNLQNIYVATRQYREDYQGYPPTLETLLPAGSIIVTSSSDHDLQKADPGDENQSIDSLEVNGVGITSGMLSPEVIDEIPTVTYTNRSLSYLKSTDEVVCPSDTIELNGFSSSYGNKLKSSWNFFGYNRLGFEVEYAPGEKMRVDPNQPYDTRRNPAKFSLSNRFAPPGTIITHCIFHRSATSNLSNPYAMGTDGNEDQGAGAQDLILRLDGSAKLRDVSRFSGTQADGSNSNWQQQNF